jgi:cysteine dioxygenase
MYTMQTQPSYSSYLPRDLFENFEDLNRFEKAVPLGLLKEVAKSARFTDEELSHLAVFDDHSYRRNLLYAGRSFHALLLCWKSGQRSPIHDHRGSGCAVKVIRGTATESVFTFAQNGMILPTVSREFEEGAVAASVDMDIHQVSNLMDGGVSLITLHLYSPPLLKMGKYSLESDIREEFEDSVHVPLYAHGGGI